MTDHPDNVVRLALIGAGSMGEKHARLIRAGCESRLAGICDLDLRCRSIAEELGVPFYQDIEELLDSERPDGAVIATPNVSHSISAEICLARSVPVLIEKPIADTLPDAQRIIMAAEERNVPVLVGHHRRHNPRVRRARQLLRDGAVGRLVAVSVLWTLLKPAEYYRADWRCRRPGGGPVLINLIHDLDCLRFVCGEIREVYARTSSAIRGLEVEDTVSVSLSFENGALGSIMASDAATAPWSYEATTGENPYYFHAEEDCYRFIGTCGSLTFPEMELWRYPDPARMGWQHPMERLCEPVNPIDPLAAQLEHFCRVVRRQSEPLVDGREGARTLAAALAVLESARRREPIDISEPT